MNNEVDPRAALRDGDVAGRAAAARALARGGQWDDLEQLVHLAKSDASASVRLYAAGAAADIALRARRAGELGPERAAQVLEWIRAFDPDVNPGLLMLMAAVATGPALDRLGRMLRDPRNGVRSGAAMALRRAALSAASEPASVSTLVGGLLANRKIPADAASSLVELVGEAGFEEHADALRALRGHEAAVEEALSRLESRRDPSSWEGLWISDGADVYEAAEEGRIEGWLAVVDGRVWDAERALGSLEREAGRAKVGELGLRMLWAPRTGSAEVAPALQGQGRTWWRADPRFLVASVDDLLDRLPPRAASAALRLLDAAEGVQAQRARALLAWRAGELDLAAELLEELFDTPKPRAELFWHLARVRLEQERREEALVAVDRFLELAGRRARHRKEAEELRAELG